MPWPGSRILWVVAFGGIVLIVSLGLFFSEPSAQGCSLTGWLERAVIEAPTGPQSIPDDVKAAILEIGPKAIPILLAKLRATDPAWKKQWAALLNKQSFYSPQFNGARLEQAQALHGFAVLGTNALSARPALEKMFWDTNTTRVAGFALGRLGETTLPVLRPALTNADYNIRSAAYDGTTLPALAVATLPEMRQMRNDQDELLAMAAVLRLMKYATKEEATRVAIEALESKRLRLRRSTLFQLDRDGIETNIVAPALIRLLEDPDMRFRWSVTNVLKRLDPVAAAAAGINTNPPPILTGRPGRRGRGPVGTNNLSPSRQ